MSLCSDLPIKIVMELKNKGGGKLGKLARGMGYLRLIWGSESVAVPGFLGAVCQSAAQYYGDKAWKGSLKENCFG